MAAKLVFSYSSGVLGCLAAASTPHSTFRIIIIRDAELPSLLQGLKDVHKKLGIGDTEGMKLLIIGGFSSRGLSLGVGPAPAAAQQHSHSVNVLRVFMPSMAFPVGLSLACLFSVSQKRDAEVTIVVGWRSWKFTVFKSQFQV